MKSVFLLYHAHDYEGQGYPSVHATFESAFAELMDQVRNYIARDKRNCHGLSIRVDELGDLEFTELFNMEFDHPEREPVWSDSSHIYISESKVKGS